MNGVSDSEEEEVFFSEGEYDQDEEQVQRDQREGLEFSSVGEHLATEQSAAPENPPVGEVEEGMVASPE
ncbi:MAG: hypothetical protein HYY44_07095 [Deltaproteobacteria bacterium]|nr:hypothetical protein [Deltaproteobacteria bacterium]